MQQLNKNYDFFFGYGVDKVNNQYIQNQEIKLAGEARTAKDGERKFKCLTLHVSEQNKNSKKPNKLFTTPYEQPFGYEFDFDNKDFIIKSAFWYDGGVDMVKGKEWLEDEIKSLNENNTKYNNVDYFKIKNKTVPIDDKGNEAKVSGYIYNEKTINNNPINDLRNIMQKKFIYRIQDIEEAKQDVATEKKKDKKINIPSVLTKKIYEKHSKDKLLSDNSFDETNYGKISFDQKKQKYVLEELNMEIPKDINQDISFCYNELDAFPIQSGGKVKVKRLYIYEDEFNKLDDQEKSDRLKEIAQVLDDQFKNEKIRIINKNKTSLITIDQFKKQFKNFI